jgi:hypothetical protein
MKRTLQQLIATYRARATAIVVARKTAELADRFDAGDESAAAELAELLDDARQVEQDDPTPARPTYQTPAQLAEARRLADQRARRQRRAEDGVTGTPKRRLAKPTAGPVGTSSRTTPKGTRP